MTWLSFRMIVLAAVLSPLVAGDAYGQAYPRGGRDVTRGTRVLPGATGAHARPGARRCSR